ncbi:hypothetical protein EPN95_03970 [Patescibacteria group bacterium]|nr:MAG: hypothetical protein EPN95_03970 [Patescibacteria group bacterium]
MVINALKLEEIARGIPVDQQITDANRGERVDEVKMAPESTPVDLTSLIQSKLDQDVRMAERLSRCACRIKCEVSHQNTWCFVITREGLHYINKRSSLVGDFPKGSGNYELLKRFIASQPFVGVFLTLRWNFRLRIPELYVRVG